jgi:SAM-dependent methyltransferase
MAGADAESALRARDTDADWRQLGQTEPYWGVLSHPDFLSQNITPEAIERFYESGLPYMATIAEALTKLTGQAPRGRALDFGCGVGRLAEAMCAYAGEVTGLDISPGMLALARARGSKVAYTDQMPDGPFDWINSFIVFQHIPPERGEAILEQLLARLADGGMISVQLTAWRDPRHVWFKETGWRRFLQARHQLAWARRLPVGHIHMFDYDLSRVVRLLNLAGIEEMQMISTDHDGHHGVIILGRKTAPAQSA